MNVALRTRRRTRDLDDALEALRASARAGRALSAATRDAQRPPPPVSRGLLMASALTGAVAFAAAAGIEGAVVGLVVGALLGFGVAKVLAARRA